ncbi:MAG: hypothetical protein ACSHWN_04605 [Methylophilaceae bacterium]
MTISHCNFEVVKDQESKPLLCCRCGRAVEPAIKEFFDEMRESAKAEGIRVLLTPCCASCVDILFGVADKNKVLN